MGLRGMPRRNTKAFDAPPSSANFSLFLTQQSAPTAEHPRPASARDAEKNEERSVDLAVVTACAGARMPMSHYWARCPSAPFAPQSPFQPSSPRGAGQQIFQTPRTTETRSGPRIVHATGPRFAQDAVIVKTFPQSENRKKHSPTWWVTSRFECSLLLAGGFSKAQQ